MRYVVAGASGFLGRALREELSRVDHHITQLVRTAPATPGQSRWDPYQGHVNSGVLREADVVVNLAGASIGRPWTRGYRETLRRSRVETTRTLATALAEIAADQTPPALVNGSGVHYYPIQANPSAEQETPTFDEASPGGQGFLSEMVSAWEQATVPAEQAGVRVVHLRTSLVLDRSGGSFPLMLAPFRLGLGGRLGSGRQYMPVVTLPDWVRAARFLTESEAHSGPYNLTLPEPVTNAEFTRALGAALGRPTPLSIPAPLMRWGLGDMSDELFGNLRAVPRRLLEAGFEFSAPDITSALRLALHQES